MAPFSSSLRSTAATAWSRPMPAVAGDAPVYVHPGRTVVSTTATSLTTIVGSGVAVCLWDPVHGVGGMAHFLLPDAGNAPPAARYGNVAMKGLVDELAAAGANVRGLRASLYGGSAPPIESETGHIGDRNVGAALAFLKERGVLVVQRDVGGTGARKVVFGPRHGASEVTKVGVA